MRGFTTARGLALALGCAAVFGALFILLKDSIVRGVWSDAYILVPTLLFIVVTAGHLAGSALRERCVLTAIGFTATFILGVVLTLYTSMSKQATSVDADILAATASNKKRDRVSTDLADIEQTLKYAIPDKEAECVGAPEPLPVGWPECRRKTASVKALTLRRDELKSALKTMEPPTPVTAGEDRVAKAANVVAGLDAGRVKDVLLTVKPFWFPLLFELTSIVAFGFAFSGSRVPVRATVKVQKAQPATPQPPPGGRRDPNVVNWVDEFRRRQGRDPSIPEIQHAWKGMAKTTAWRYAKDRHEVA